MSQPSSSLGLGSTPRTRSRTDAQHPPAPPLGDVERPGGSAVVIRPRAPLAESKQARPYLSDEVAQPSSSPLGLLQETKTGGPPISLSKSRGRRGRRVRNAPSGRSRKSRAAAPSLPPTLEVVMAVPFRIRCVSSSTVAFNNLNPISRAGFAGMLGTVGKVVNSTVVGWAVSYRITAIYAWPAAGGDVFLDSVLGGGAEQALQKDSLKIDTLPTGITVPVAGHVWRPKRGSYLSMWQVSATNGSDVILQYASTAGSVFDFCGVFTLSSGDASGPTISVGTAAVGAVYYLCPDGNVTHNLVPQGYTTTF